MKPAINLPISLLIHELIQLLFGSQFYFGISQQKGYGMYKMPKHECKFIFKWKSYISNADKYNPHNQDSSEFLTAQI